MTEDDVNFLRTLDLIKPILAGKGRVDQAQVIAELALLWVCEHKTAESRRDALRLLISIMEANLQLVGIARPRSARPAPVTKP